MSPSDAPTAPLAPPLLSLEAADVDASAPSALRPAGEARAPWRSLSASTSAASSSAAQQQQPDKDKDSSLLADVRASLRQLELERASRVATLQSQQALLLHLRGSAGAEEQASPGGLRGRIPAMLASPATPASQQSQPQRPSPEASSAASSSMARIGRGQYE